jgi:hypothetical protein
MTKLSPRMTDETKAMLSLQPGESLVLAARGPYDHGGRPHFRWAAKSRGYRLRQQREGDFIRYQIEAI